MKEKIVYPFQLNEGSLGESRKKSKRVQAELGKTSLTEKQATILNFLAKHSEWVGFPPTIREIGDYFGVSVKAASDHLQAISKKGYIRVFPNRARGIEIISNPTQNRTIKLPSKEETTTTLPNNLVSVPLLGRISAGVPILAEENIEENLLLPKTLIPQTGNFFALQISGDSMKDAGILDGDIAVIQKVESFKNEVKNGDIVVALIDAEATLKTYFLKEKTIELHPQNKAYKKITLQAKDEPKILGKLRGIYRKY